MSTGTKGKRLIVAPGPWVEIEEFNLPEPGPHQFLVRVTRSQISAGTEMNFVRHGARAYSSRPELNIGSPVAGRPLGYMTVGVVEMVGPGVTGYAPGDRVLTSGNHGSHWLVDLKDTGPSNWYAEKLDDAIPDEQAGFAILGDVALHGVRRAGLQIDESVAVFGAGIVGQITIQLARLSGAYLIIAVDLYPSRLEKARENGATHLVNANENPVAAIREITGGAGAETVFHCAAVPRILQTTMEAAADRGKVVLTGSAPGTAEIGL
ncbi:MAG: zinc-binding dehydrogenase, partial [Chloroflexi bacterium]|nr:zinc-binding dehydrogenase [Chloroflexota bacterium]